MSQPAPTFGQIRARVQAIRRKIPDARVVGIQALGRWNGDQMREDGAEVYRIEQCDSSLAARIALMDDEPGVNVLVIVTSLSEQELGEDVRVRLAGRKFYTLDPWQIVKELFQAQTVDPRLLSHSWIPDRLLEFLPAGGWPPLPGGYLDAEAVWPLLFQRLIGLDGERPDLVVLLRWSIETENVLRFCRLPEEVRQGIVDWLVAQVGPTATAVLRCASTLEQPDLLPTGIISGIVHHPHSNGRMDRAAGRLERFLGGPTPEASVVERWSAASIEVVRMLDDPRVKSQVLHRADEILREIQADEYAYLSDVLPRGFEQRLNRLGSLLGSAVQDGSRLSKDLVEAREAIRRHDQARRDPRRLERVEMALRLARWLDGAAGAVPRSLGEAARDYLSQGSFVDWARSVLRAGEPVRELSVGYSQLLERVTARREQQNRCFAEMLRDQVALSGQLTDLVPVERVLDEIVTPLAAIAPVLLILLDGMSPAVSRELLTDISRMDWLSLGPEGHPLRPGLAAIPCVTEVSRASLFCGRLCIGTSSDEASGFANHAGLRSHCRSGSPPVLFHKIALQEAADASLAAKVREAIAATQKRVVGVVINAVDDHLLKGEQLDLRWSRDEIKVLPSLLYEARSARRVVVVLSDHGHLLDYQTEERPGIGKERWRSDDGVVGEGELAVQGPRVLLAAEHRLIAPSNERIRYVGKRNGYHGGLTPQEMVIPITVLACGELHLKGWAETPDPTPDWWEESPSSQAAPAAVPSVKPPSRKVPETLWDVVAAEPGPSVVVPATVAAAAPSPSWIPSLLSSPIFEEQKKLGGRAVPPDEVFARLLGSLDGAGGKLTATALSRKLALSPFRLRGLLAVVQRVLNIDGFAVLNRDEQSDTIELDRLLLLRQFDLLAEDRP